MNGTVETARIGRITRIGRLGAIALAAIGLSAAVVVAPSPSGSVATAHADDTDLQPRLERACARIPTAEARLQAAIDRLDAPATERGSLAWLAAAIERAESKNRPRLATELQRRLDRQTARRATLDERRAQLDHLVEVCAERGIAV